MNSTVISIPFLIYRCSRSLINEHNPADEHRLANDYSLAVRLTPFFAANMPVEAALTFLIFATIPRLVLLIVCFSSHSTTPRTIITIIISKIVNEI